MEKPIKIALLSLTNISCSNATGSLLYRLFKDWAPSQVLQITKYHHQDEVADRYTQIVPFYDFMEKQRTSTQLIQRIPAVVLRRIFWLLRFFLGNKKQVLEKLKAFKPDLLYLRVVGDPYYYLSMALYLKKHLDIPLICHHMDDYEAQLQNQARYNPLKWINSRLYCHYLRRVIQRSQLNLAISESMKEAFELRYGKPFSVIHNGIEPEELAYFQNQQISRSIEKFTLLWAGAIEKDKDDRILKCILEAIQQTGQTSEFELILNVPKRYLPIAGQFEQKYDFVKSQVYQPLDEYRRLLASAHLLLIVRNFDERTKIYTQYSFHNKLPDFLASGTPILSIGPSWDNTIRLFKKYGFGHYLETDNVEAIKNKILSVREDYAATESKARKAADLAFKIYDMNLIRQKFSKACTGLLEKEKEYISG